MVTKGCHRHLVTIVSQARSLWLRRLTIHGFLLLIMLLLATCSRPPGELAGTLEISGGTPGQNGQHVPGVVTIRSSEGQTITRKVGQNGQFLVFVPVGTYTVTGRSPVTNQAPPFGCQVATPVNVAQNGITQVIVACPVN